MSGHKSPLRKSTNGSSPNSSASSIVSFHGNWAQEVRLAEQECCDLQPPNSSGESSVKNVHGYSSNDLDQSEGIKNQETAASEDREISLEFIEGVNEEKFERLLKEEKLKTPFKRRYSQTPSNGSRSDSTNGSNSDNEGDYSSSNFKRTTNHSKRQYEDQEQKRLRYNSYGGSSTFSKEKQVEDDPVILARRQKQIDYGKNTVAYERYLEMVPIRKRNHPKTPDKYGKYSRRTFDGLIKVWRKQLHYYDPEPVAGKADDNDDSD